MEDCKCIGGRNLIINIVVIARRRNRPTDGRQDGRTDVLPVEEFVGWPVSPAGPYLIGAALGTGEGSGATDATIHAYIRLPVEDGHDFE